MDSQDYDCEVRFAVVLYGGVSLAIYINGVVNQLLKMVEATSSKKDKEGIYAVYRQAANSIFQKENCNVRLMVDVISGTSAGGINGVFLAKALANNQNLDGLKLLWVDEGDVGKLLNDRTASNTGDIAQQEMKEISNQGLRYKTMKQVKDPRSLLNSDRMYRKLCEALYSMEGPGLKPEAGYSPDRIDLFVTTTNFYGRHIPIQLADKLVWERRYKHVFHLTNFADPLDNATTAKSNQFEIPYNPFLAFAARCTSAFPFAFEPMSFYDIETVFPDLKLEIFDSLFLVEKPPEPKDPPKEFGFKDCAFVDGGYLNNKPFSYVIDTISHRKSDRQVIRKLLYVEPSPENLIPPEQQQNNPNEHEVKKPDPFQNSWGALSSLPRYETIVENIQQIQERNNFILRVKRVINDMEQDLKPTEDDIKRTPLTDHQWAKCTLSDMIAAKGKLYAPYHRLDVSTLTDYLADALCKAMGFREESAFFQIIRKFVSFWRDGNYPDSTIRFLFEFNLPYHLRRIVFVQQKIDVFFSVVEEGLSKRIDNVKWRFNNVVRERPIVKEIGILAIDDKDVLKMTEIRERLEKPKEDLHKAYNILRVFDDYLLNYTSSTFHPLLENVKDEVWKVKTKLSEVLNDPDKSKALLSAFRELLMFEKPTQPDSGVLVSNGLSDSEISSFLKKCEKDITQALSIKDIRLFIEGFRKITETYLVNFKAKFSKESDIANSNLGNFTDREMVKNLRTEPSVSNKIFASIIDYYQNYDDIDMLTLPITYGTDFGEGTTIEVHRVSPCDATSLIDEQKYEFSKLAGTSFGDFGAFLKKDWRKSDMLWGELDGAECIIRSLISDPKKAEELIRNAQREILLQTIEERNKNGEDVEIGELLTGLIINARKKPTAFNQFLGNVTDLNISGFSSENLKRHFEKAKSQRKHFPSKEAFSILKRAAAVTLRIIRQSTVDGKRGIIKVILDWFESIPGRIVTTTMTGFQHPWIFGITIGLLGVLLLLAPWLLSPNVVHSGKIRILLAIIGLLLLCSNAFILFLRHRAIASLSEMMPGAKTAAKDN